MYIPQPNSRSTLWGRRGKLLLIPAGVIAFVLLLSWVNSPTPEGGNRLYSRYALQQSYQQYTDASSEYKIAVISDMDTASRIGEDMKWKGILKFGKLIRTAGKYSVEWTNEVRNMFFFATFAFVEKHPKYHWQPICCAW
jgi:hypothetical protein